MVWRLVGLTAGVLFVAAAAVYGVYGANVWRWGGPSQEELERPQDAVRGRAGLRQGGSRARENRVAARAQAGALLRRSDRPSAEAAGVTLTLVVCRAYCEVSRFQVRPGRPRHQVRFGFSTAANVAGWISGSDRRADNELRDPLYRAIDGLGTTADSGSRCYIG